MKVDNAAKQEAHKTAIERQKIISQHRKEVNHLNKSYNKLKAELKVDGDQQLFRQRSENDKKILEEAERKNIVLQKMNSLTADSKQMLEDEKTRVNETHKGQVAESRMKAEKTIADLQTKNGELFQDITTKYTQEMQNIQQEGNRFKQDHFDEFASDLNTKEAENSGKTTKQAGRFEQTFKTDSIKFENTLAKQRYEMEQKYQKRKHDHQILMKKLQSLHTDEVSKLMKHHKQKVGGMQTNFTNQYDSISKMHHKQLGNLQQITKDNLNETVGKYSDKKKVVEDKAGDNFYRTKYLTPIVSENVDSYTVKMQVPEHEKDQITLTGKGKRDLRMTINRAHDSEFVEHDGTINKSKRYETISKSIHVDKIMNLKKITKEYADGNVIYNIKKA